jgi:hypothetical protein
MTLKSSPRDDHPGAPWDNPNRLATNRRVKLHVGRLELRIEVLSKGRDVRLATSRHG